jgi:hypothetical protein
VRIEEISEFAFLAYLGKHLMSSQATTGSLPASFHGYFGPGQLILTLHLMGGQRETTSVPVRGLAISTSTWLAGADPERSGFGMTKAHPARVPK